MDGKYDFKFNIFLLGDVYSGKTCLLKRFVYNIFLEQNSSTTVDYKRKLIEFDKYKIKLIIWDIGGNENFRIPNRKFYKAADGIIFNFNIIYKNTLKELDYFINDVKKKKHNGYDSIICANCCDLEERRIITKEELKYYELKYNIKIFETSAKSGLNINTAFNYLIYQILKRKLNKKVLKSFESSSNIRIDIFENRSNIRINYYKISLFKEPSCKNIFKKQYFYNINGNYIQLNIIDNNSSLDGDGLIFYVDMRHKNAVEYILNKINATDDYYLNKNKTIIIYKTIKDKEDILIKLDYLCYKKSSYLLR